MPLPLHTALAMDLCKAALNTRGANREPMPESSHNNGRDRTYGSAVALRQWFRSNNVQMKTINVVKETTHTRRTRFLFQKACGDLDSIAIKPREDLGNIWDQA